MSLQAGIEIVLALLAIMVGLAWLARRLGVPYPIVFVLGGFAVGMIPAVPEITVPPDLVLLLFLPLLLYSAGVYMSPQRIQRNLQPIAFLAIGLVVVTTLAVGAVAHLTVADLPWGAAFVLGTLVASTDSVTAVAIARSLGLPSRLVTIIEGESLFNDASSLALYQVAVAAVVTGHFSLARAGLGFVVAVIGGIGIGLAAGWLAARIRGKLCDSTLEITVTLLTPFLAWIPAERLGVSAVIAVAAAGMYVGVERVPDLSSSTRLRLTVFWEVLDFLIEGLLFVLTGLQLRQALGGLVRLGLGTAALDVTVICLTVIAVRAAWVFLDAYTPGLFHRQTGSSSPDWREVAVVAWAGMRGGEALAPALALPLVTASGAAFPGRGILISLTLAVIFVTLVAEGLSLPFLARRLGVRGAEEVQRQEREARIQMLQAALGRLDALGREEGTPASSVARVRQKLEHRLRDLTGEISAKHRKVDEATYRLRLAAIETERQTVEQLRAGGDIDDEVARDIDHELDLEEVTLRTEAA